MTRAGDLDRRVTVMRKGGTNDPEYGPQPGADVVVAARVPARRLDLLPLKTEQQGGVLRQSHKPTRIQMRYVPGVTSDMWLIMHDENDAIYQIMSQPAEIGRRQFIEFTAAAYTS